MHNSTSKLYFDQARIHALQLMLCVRIDELLERLEVDVRQSKKMYYGCCPVHGGDNINALNLFPEGDSVPGYWRCYTKGCHRHFKRTILGFIRGVLSHQRFDWQPNVESKQRILSYENTVDWACEFLGKELKNVDVDYEALEKHKFVNEVRVLNQLPNQKVSNLTRVKVRSKLQIPAKYFLERGWGQAVLDRYDVGLCNDPAKPFYERVVVPIYDNAYKHVMGFTARSIHPKCLLCSLYHAPSNPCPNENLYQYSKWRNSEGFNRDSQLYNYWFAKRYIEETGIAILVEGPGDTWRLWEADFHVGLGMLGTNLTDQQQVLLETSGAMNIVVITNNDEAGLKSDADLKEQLGRTFRLHFVKPKKNDLGDTSINEVKELIGPLYCKLLNRGY